MMTGCGDPCKSLFFSRKTVNVENRFTDMVLPIPGLVGNKKCVIIKVNFFSVLFFFSFVFFGEIQWPII